MAAQRESKPFTLSIAARKNSLTKYAAHVWDYDPGSRLLTERSAHGDLPDRRVEVEAFAQLIVGEDVRGTAPNGAEFHLGELQAFTFNKEGTEIPRFLAP
jgi:hypothetical protein